VGDVVSDDEHDINEKQSRWIDGDTGFLDSRGPCAAHMCTCACVRWRARECACMVRDQQHLYNTQFRGSAHNGNNDDAE
jgi:hypothetical protein